MNAVLGLKESVPIYDFPNLSTSLGREKEATQRSKKGKGHLLGNNAQNNQKDREIEADFLNAGGMGKGIKKDENPHEAENATVQNPGEQGPVRAIFKYFESHCLLGLPARPEPYFNFPELHVSDKHGVCI